MGAPAIQDQANRLAGYLFLGKPSMNNALIFHPVFF